MYDAVLLITDDVVTVANSKFARHLSGTDVLGLGLAPGLYYLKTDPAVGYRRLATLTYNACELAVYDVNGVELTFCELGVRRILGRVPRALYIRKSAKGTHKWLPEQEDLVCESTRQ